MCDAASTAATAVSLLPSALCIKMPIHHEYICHGYNNKEQAHGQDRKPSEKFLFVYGLYINEMGCNILDIGLYISIYICILYMLWYTVSWIYVCLMPSRIESSRSRTLAVVFFLSVGHRPIYIGFLHDHTAQRHADCSQHITYAPMTLSMIVNVCVLDSWTSYMDTLVVADIKLSFCLILVANSSTYSRILSARSQLRCVMRHRPITRIYPSGSPLIPFASCVPSAPTRVLSFCSIVYPHERVRMNECIL